MVAQDQEEALGNGPGLEARRHVAGERTRPFVGGVSVQAHVQPGAGALDGFQPGRFLHEGRRRACLQVVAQCGVARSMRHMARIVLAQLHMQGRAVRVLQGDQGKVRLRTLLERLRSAQRPHYAGRFVGVLAAGNHQPWQRAFDVGAVDHAPLRGKHAEALAAQGMHLDGRLLRRQGLREPGKRTR